MAIEASKIRRWLDEEDYEVTAGSQPEATFSYTAKTASGLQITVWQPKKGSGKVLVSAAIGFSDDERERLRPKVEQALWTIRYGLLQIGVGFEIAEEDGMPKVIALVAPVWEDALAKSTLLAEVQRVINAMVLVIVSVRHVLESP